jgi:hypothetical protein
MPGTAAMTILAFPPTPRTARDVAHRLRCNGFYSLPYRTWGHVADLAELLTEYTPTTVQVRWLRAAHQQFLITSGLR